MLHNEVLARLFPLELGGMHEDDVAVDGAALDRVQAAVDALLLEMYPGTATLLLERWEALYEIVPAPGATIEQRQAAAEAKYLLKPDIKKPFLVAMAASIGFTIRIDDYIESMSEWLCADDELLEEPWEFFEAGLAGAGDTLAFQHDVLNWIWEVVVISGPAAPSPALEELLQDLRSADIQLNFTYL